VLADRSTRPHPIPEHPPVTTHHHPTKTTLTALGIGLVIAALTTAHVTQASASTSSTTSGPRQSVQIVRVSDHGFDWGDAGIGAAAGIGLAMLTVGAGLILTDTRRAHTPRARLTAKEQP
jgi:hypothetical protein